MTSGIKTIIYPVKDLARAKTLYSTLLGIEPSIDEVYYVRSMASSGNIALTLTRPCRMPILHREDGAKGTAA